jgi:hypothetical protein
MPSGGRALSSAQIRSDSEFRRGALTMTAVSSISGGTAKMLLATMNPLMRSTDARSSPWKASAARQDAQAAKDLDQHLAPAQHPAERALVPHLPADPPALALFPHADATREHQEAIVDAISDGPRRRGPQARIFSLRGAARLGGGDEETHQKHREDDLAHPALHTT